VLVTNLAPCVGLRMHLWPEKGQQGENGLDNKSMEVTMRMVQLPSGPTHPQVLVSFFSFLSRDWVCLSSTRPGMFNMVNNSLIP
jgi:hypothetical protein